MCCNKATLAFILNGAPPTQVLDHPEHQHQQEQQQQHHHQQQVSPLPLPKIFAPHSPGAGVQTFTTTTTCPMITSCDPENRTGTKRLAFCSKALSICDLLCPEPTARAAATLPKRRKVVNCQVPECKSRALTRKLCMRHGGGSRCQYPDCTNGAKLRNLCFQHGGSTACLVVDCDNIAKRFGYCWTHGGAYVCSAPSCKKFAAQGGLCWAHGGGNRCGFEGCTKRSYKQYDYHCKEHATATGL